MNLEPVKTFVKSPKGKTAIVGAITGVVLYFFPNSAQTIGDFATFLGDIFGQVGDKI